jgi:hypothetical protein
MVEETWLPREVILNLLLRVVIERELNGLHGLLQVSRLAAKLHQALQHLFCLVPLKQIFYRDKHSNLFSWFFSHYLSYLRA